MKLEIKRRKIHDVMESVENDEDKRAAAIDFVLKKLKIKPDDERKKRISKHLETTFFAHYFRRISTSKTADDQRIAQWLDVDCTIPGSLLEKSKPPPPPSPSEPKIKKKQGRPVKAFEDSSVRSKGRKYKELTSGNSLEILKYAVTGKLREEGNLNAANLIKEILSSPSRAKEMWTLWKTPEKPHIQLSDLLSLELMQNAKLSKRQYIMARDITMKGTLGSYGKIQKLRHSVCNFEIEKERILAETTSVTAVEEKVPAPVEVPCFVQPINPEPLQLDFNNTHMFFTIN